MTNEQIIYENSVALMKQGVLKCAGQVPFIDEATGETKMVDMPECIHTFQGWKELGYKVKKGEHHVAEFAIWSPSKRKPKDDEDEKPQRRMYLRKAFWFTSAQVEKDEGRDAIC